MQMQLDVEAPERRATPAQQVHLPMDSPYDLEQVAANYEGRAKIVRLIFIANSCVSLAGPALTLALSTILSTTLDTGLYQTTYAQYLQLATAIEAGEVTDAAAKDWHAGVVAKEGKMAAAMDTQWIARTKSEAGKLIDKLEVELKGYTTNLIKESIRMGHRDLARCLHRTGDLPGAIRAYTKGREYCTTSQDILEMCMGVIEVALELSSYSFVRNYVAKAETALEGLNPALSSKPKVAAVVMPGMVAPAVDPVEAAKEKERAAIGERLMVANGVAHLGSGSYERAAQAFTSIGREALSFSVGHFIPPADIGLYAVLTGLAAFDRTELRRKLLENADLRPMLDLEPYLRDVLRAFYGSKFKEGFNLLEKYSARQRLDTNLAPHLNALLTQIRSRALLSYFEPYSSVSLKRMASAFGFDQGALTRSVIELIEQGRMLARVDKERGILVKKSKEVRGEAFRNALVEGEKLQRSIVASQFRLKLMKADILVKASKETSGPSAHY